MQGLLEGFLLGLRAGHWLMERDRTEVVSVRDQRMARGVRPRQREGGTGSKLTPDATLPQFRERLEAEVAKKQAEGYSGRLLFYVDMKRGRVVEGGELEAAKPWTGADAGQ